MIFRIATHNILIECYFLHLTAFPGHVAPNDYQLPFSKTLVKKFAWNHFHPGMKGQKDQKGLINNDYLLSNNTQEYTYSKVLG